MYRTINLKATRAVFGGSLLQVESDTGRGYETIQKCIGNGWIVQRFMPVFNR